MARTSSKDALSQLPILSVLIGAMGAELEVRPHDNGETTLTLRKMCGNMVCETLSQAERDALVRILIATRDANDYRGLADGIVPMQNCRSSGLRDSSRRS